MVSLDSAYGSEGKRGVINRSVFSVVLSSNDTLLHYLRTHRKLIISNVTKLLSKKHMHFIDDIDNNQKGYPMKNQRFGSSNKFVTVIGLYVK